MKTIKFKTALYFIVFCGIIMCINGSNETNIVSLIVQVISGSLLTMLAVELAFITKHEK